MRDPKPENITGEKTQQHVFKHQINWSHAAIAVAILVLSYVIYTSHRDEEDQR